jgi:hypothetical protein
VPASERGAVVIRLPCVAADERLWRVNGAVLLARGAA